MSRKKVVGAAEFAQFTAEIDKNTLIGLPNFPNNELNSASSVTAKPSSNSKTGSKMSREKKIHYSGSGSVKRRECVNRPSVLSAFDIIAEEEEKAANREDGSKTPEMIDSNVEKEGMIHIEETLKQTKTEENIVAAPIITPSIRKSVSMRGKSRTSTSPHSTSSPFADSVNFEIIAMARNLRPEVVLPKKLYNVINKTQQFVVPKWQKLSPNHYSAKIIELYQREYPIAKLNQINRTLRGRPRLSFFDRPNINKEEPKSSFSYKPPFINVSVQLNHALFSLVNSCDEYEPLFLSMAIYDIDERKRISEEFYTQNNGNSILELCKLDNLRNNPPPKEGVFLMPEWNEHTYKNFYLILKIYRIFIGDIDSELNLYRKNDTTALRALATRVSEQVQRFPQQTPVQPYCWTSFRLCRKNHEIRATLMADNAYPCKTAFSDDLLFDTILGKIKTPKPIATDIKLFLSHYSASLQASTNFSQFDEFSFSPTTTPNSLRKYSNTRNKTTLRSFLIQKQISPHFEHDLYIYPISANFSSVVDLLISFQVVKNEEFEKGLTLLKCGYVRSFFSNPINPSEIINTAFSYDAYSTVCCGSKNPTFGDEIKLAVPVNFFDYCLVATIFQVSPGTDKRSLLGSFVLNLEEDGTFISDSVYHFPVEDQTSKALNVQHISAADAKKLKKVFSYRTRLVSTIVPRNSGLESFLKSNFEQSSFSNNFILSGKTCKCPTYELLRFFPTLIQILLNACATEEDEKLRTKAFVTIFRLLRLVSDYEVQNSGILEYYLRELYNPVDFIQIKQPQKQRSHRRTHSVSGSSSASKAESGSSSSKEETITVHSVLLKIWSSLITKKRKSMTDIENCSSLWFVLSLIRKSIILSIQNNNEETRSILDFYHSKKLAEVLQSVLTSVVDSFLSNRLVFHNYGLDQITEHLSEFLLLADRGPMCSMLNDFVGKCISTDTIFSSSVVHQLVFKKLFKSIFSNQYIVQLNSPIDNPESIFDSLDTITFASDFRQTYPLCGLLVHYLSRAIAAFSVENISADDVHVPITVLRDFLDSVSVDHRFFDKVVQSNIVAMVFPYFHTFISYNNLLTSDDAVLYPLDYIICFSYLLKCTSDALLLKWWDLSVPSFRSHLFAAFWRIAPHAFVDANDISIAVRVLELILRERKSDVNSTIIENILSAILIMFSICEEEHICLIFSTVELIFDEYLSVLFSTSKLSLSFNELCVRIMTFMNAGFEKTQEYASSLLCKAITKSLAEERLVEQLRPQFSAIASRLSGEDLGSDQNLLLSLESVEKKIASSKEINEYIKRDGNSLIQHIIMIVRNNKRFIETNNLDTLVDLFFSSIISYLDSPSLLTTWIDNLYDKLIENNCHSEAAQCKIHLAYVQMQYLSVNEECNYSLKAFAPNIESAIVPIVSKSSLNPSYTTDDVVDSVLLALDSWNRASDIELSIRATNLFLTEIYLAQGNNDRVYECTKSALVQAEMLKSADNKKVRLYPKYFRVAFYVGKDLQEFFPEIVKCKQFVYKKSPASNLRNMSEEISKYLSTPPANSKQYRCEPVLISNNVSSINPEPRQILFQIGFVEPYFSSDRKLLQPSAMHFGTNQFMFEQLLSNSTHLRDHQKQRIIYTTDFQIPFVLTRYKIIDEKEFIISPIENAVDIVVGHVNKLREQLRHQPPKQNQLHQTLQGVIMPMVNAGVLLLCETFLKTVSSESTQQQLQNRLSFELSILMNITGYALSCYHMIFSDPTCKQLHELLQVKFNELVEKVKQFIKTKHTIYHTTEFEHWENYTKLPQYNDQ